MSNKEILEKAIQKAIEGGWSVFGTECHQLEVFEATQDIREDNDHYYGDAPYNGLFLDVRRWGYYSVNDIIFNHDFATALWGETETSLGEPSNVFSDAWRIHLMRMVIADDPIKYLGENL